MTRPVRKPTVNSRAKGQRAERQARDPWRSAGFPCERGNNQHGQADCIGVPRVHLEIKHRERAEIWEWLAQAARDAKPDELPIVQFKRNRSPWYLAIPLDRIDLSKIPDLLKEPLEPPPQT